MKKPSPPPPFSTASVCFAQAPIRNDLAADNTAARRRPKTVPRAYKVMSEPAFGSPGHVIFRPEDPGKLPGRDKLPVMAWRRRLRHQQRALLINHIFDMRFSFVVALRRTFYRCF